MAPGTRSKVAREIQRINLFLRQPDAFGRGEKLRPGRGVKVDALAQPACFGAFFDLARHQDFAVGKYLGGAFHPGDKAARISAAKASSA